MLDHDLAELKSVDTWDLTRAVQRNIERFPDDFMFRLSQQEASDLRRQFGVSSSWCGRSRSVPTAFTQEGVAMLSSVLRSRRAVMVNVEIMRTFVKLRRILVSHEEFARKLDALEGKYDRQFKIVFDAIRQLMTAPEPKIPRIGIHAVRERD